MLKKKKKRKKKLQKTQIIPEVNNYKKMKQTSRNKSFFTKTILTYGKDITMSCRTQTSEVLKPLKFTGMNY